MPALLAAAAARFSLTDGEIGMVGSSFLAGFGLVAATSNQWIGRFNWRHIVGVGTAVAVAGLAGCAAISSYGALLAALVAAGAGLGLLYTVSIAVVSENHKPDRAFGVKLASEVFLAVAALMGLTAFVTARWGFAGTALTLAGVVGVVSLIGLPAIPSGRALTPPAERFGMARRAGGGAPLLRDWAPWLGLSALFVSFAGLSALWAFVSQMAPSFGVDSRTGAVLLTIGLAVSGLAGLAAAGLGDRFGRIKPLATGMGLALVGVGTLQFGHGLAAYFAGLLLAAGLWNFQLAYQMGIIASADERGHVAVLMPAALAVGGALGPMLAGALLTGGHGYLPLYALFAATTAIGLAAFIVLGRRVAAAGART
ncbi:MAG TPA: MFS transporter [Caulobacteraceae bacterium]|nr:MFS transporter [Caulobacteraceae bacterium]